MRFDVAKGAFIVFAMIVGVHLSVLTFAAGQCISSQVQTERLDETCERLGVSWQRAVENYISVILALLVPVSIDRSNK